MYAPTHCRRWTSLPGSPSGPLPAAVVAVVPPVVSVMPDLLVPGSVPAPPAAGYLRANSAARSAAGRRYNSRICQSVSRATSATEKHHGSPQSAA